MLLTAVKKSWTTHRTHNFRSLQVTDELTKNHRTGELQKETERGMMVQNKEDPKNCPVRIFEWYLERLNPDNEWLWQAPYKVKRRDDEPWYTRAKLGKNAFGGFMPELSTTCGLSKRYTNHDCRATGITILSRLQYAPGMIMSASGHTSVNSLARYNRVQVEDKLAMGMSLMQAMTKPVDQVQGPEALYPRPNPSFQNQPMVWPRRAPTSTVSRPPSVPAIDFEPIPEGASLKKPGLLPDPVPMFRQILPYPQVDNPIPPSQNQPFRQILPYPQVDSNPSEGSKAPFQMPTPAPQVDRAQPPKRKPTATAPNPNLESFAQYPTLDKPLPKPVQMPQYPQIHAEPTTLKDWSLPAPYSIYKPVKAETVIPNLQEDDSVQIVKVESGSPAIEIIAVETPPTHLASPVVIEISDDSCDSPPPKIPHARS